MSDSKRAKSASRAEGVLILEEREGGHKPSGTSGRNHREATSAAGTSVPSTRVDSPCIPEIGAAPDFLLKFLLQEIPLSQKVPKMLIILSQEELPKLQAAAILSLSCGTSALLGLPPSFLLLCLSRHPPPTLANQVIREFYK